MYWPYLKQQRRISSTVQRTFGLGWIIEYQRRKANINLLQAQILPGNSYVASHELSPTIAEPQAPSSSGARNCLKLEEQYINFTQLQGFSNYDDCEAKEAIIAEALSEGNNTR